MTRRTFLLSPIAVFGVSVLLPSTLQGMGRHVVYAEAPIAVESHGAITPGRLAAISTRAMQAMETRLGIRLKSDDLLVRLCRDDEDYRQAGGLGNTDACFLAPARILLHDRRGVEGDLSHEYAHALIEQQTHGKCPAWLEEGIVNHENRITPTGQYSRRTAARLRNALDRALSDQKWSLASLSEEAQRSRVMSDVFYGAAWSATDYLYREHGRDAVLRAVRLMSSEHPDDACRLAFGRDLGSLELEWRRQATTDAGTKAEGMRSAASSLR